MPKPSLRLSDVSVCRAIHGLTVSGILVGMLALMAVFDGSPRLAIILLVATVIIDGVDGPLARRWHISEVIPKYDGHALDLVIDFVTNAVVPVGFAWEFGLVPHNTIGQLTLGLILVTTALWFARTDMQTEDNWFRGFPAAWNMVIPTFWLLELDHSITVPAMIVLSLLQLTDVEFAHTMQVVQWRAANIAANCGWMLAMIVMTIVAPRHNLATDIGLLVGPAWTIGSTIAHHLGRTRVTATA